MTSNYFAMLVIHVCTVCTYVAYNIWIRIQKIWITNELLSYRILQEKEMGVLNG